MNSARTYDRGGGSQAIRFATRGGVTVERTVETLPVEGATESLIDALDSRQGLLLASSYEVPGRYTRWDIGFCDPPLEIAVRGRRFQITARNARGKVLLLAVAPVVRALPAG